MQLRIPRPFLSLVVLALVAVPLLSLGTTSADTFTYSHFNAIQRRLLSGFADLELNPNSPLQTASTRPTSLRTLNLISADPCPINLGSDVRVNRDCENISDQDLQGRAQAQDETAIAVDPTNPQRLVAFYNNYQRGDGDCIGAFSLDGGKSWANTYAPTSFTRGTAFGNASREYWQAHGDPSVAWDTKGNAYLSCQVFNRGTAASANTDASSAVYVYRSTGTKGASWDFPGRPVIEYYDPTGSSGVLEDKPYMTVDNHVGSPFQDRVYVTYTEFAADGTAYIYESHSSDYGQTFSPRVVVSTTSTLCSNTYGLPTPNGTCNQNQFSDPFVGPDGALYVVYANFNNATSSLHGGDTATTTTTENFNQMLLAKSTDGGSTFSAPVLVGNYYDLPDCATYQNGSDFGRACVPESGPTTNSVFRATNYPSGAVSPSDPSKVVVTYGSYINRDSNERNGCVPNGLSSSTGLNLYVGVKVPGACNNDILVSTSSDAGASFTGTTANPRVMPVVTNASGQARTDQYWQWEAFTSDGAVVVSYYDRQYGNDNLVGNSDMTLSSSRDLATFEQQRVTTGSMPPPTQFSGQFFGDYSGIAASTVAYPLWMDTRMDELFTCPPSSGAPMLCIGTATNAPLANDQDVFTSPMTVP